MKKVTKGERNYAIKLAAFALGAILVFVALIFIGAFIAKFFIE